MSLNYIDIEDKEQFVYRVFKFEYLLKSIVNSNNVLVSPTLWDDPFENPLFRNSRLSYNNQEVKFTHQYFYGQCWTFNFPPTDATWRIYSQDKSGVIVKSKISSLLATFEHATSREDHTILTPEHTFIGKVDYKSESELLHHYQKSDEVKSSIRAFLIDGKKPDNQLIKNFFLIKRDSFQYENELRIIYFDREGLNGDFNTVSYYINPYQVFEEFIFDPRIDKTLFEKLKWLLENQNPKCMRKIWRDGLYDSPTIKIEI